MLKRLIGHLHRSAIPGILTYDKASAKMSTVLSIYGKGCSGYEVSNRSRSVEAAKCRKHRKDSGRADEKLKMARYFLGRTIPIVFPALIFRYRIYG